MSENKQKVYLKGAEEDEFCSFSISPEGVGLLQWLQDRTNVVDDNATIIIPDKETFKEIKRCDNTRTERVILTDSYNGTTDYLTLTKEQIWLLDYLIANKYLPSHSVEALFPDSDVDTISYDELCSIFDKTKK